jgi:hypothetical protein
MFMNIWLLGIKANKKGELFGIKGEQSNEKGNKNAWKGIMFW